MALVVRVQIHVGDTSHPLRGFLPPFEAGRNTKSFPDLILQSTPALPPPPSLDTHGIFWWYLLPSELLPTQQTAYYKISNVFVICNKTFWIVKTPPPSSIFQQLMIKWHFGTKDLQYIFLGKFPASIEWGKSWEKSFFSREHPSSFGQNYFLKMCFDNCSWD